MAFTSDDPVQMLACITVSSLLELHTYAQGLAFAQMTGQQPIADRTLDQQFRLKAVDRLLAVLEAHRPPTDSRSEPVWEMMQTMACAARVVPPSPVGRGDDRPTAPIVDLFDKGE